MRKFILIAAMVLVSASAQAGCSAVPTRSSPVPDVPGGDGESMRTLAVKMYRTPDRVTVAAPTVGLLPGDIGLELTTIQLVLGGAARGTYRRPRAVSPPPGGVRHHTEP